VKQGCISCRTKVQVSSRTTSDPHSHSDRSSISSHRRLLFADHCATLRLLIAPILRARCSASHNTRHLISMFSIPLPTVSSLLSLLIPITYLSILIGSMATFSYLYRRRQALHKLRLAPYFGPHTTRNVYLSLLHLPESEKAPKVPDSVLRAALLSRACTDVERILLIRSRKPALNTLLQRGVVGDEIYQRLIRAEQELEAELKDVVAEANALAPNWGQSIFQSASEMVQNRLLKEKLAERREGIEEERAQWAGTKEKARRELMGEEVEDSSADEKVAVSVVEKAAKVGSSDDEGVMVDTPDNGSVDGSVSGGGGGKKKKKGKK
jgi:translocation protein SEC66